MGDLVIFPRSPDRPVRPPQPCPVSLPVQVYTDAELATEKSRVDGRACRHHDGRVGVVAGVWREGPAILAKLWRGHQYDPVLASKLVPVGGRVA